MQVNEELVNGLLKSVKALEIEIDRLKEKSNNQEKELEYLKCGTVNQKPEMSIESRIVNLLHFMGIPKHLKGYLYFQETIKRVYEDMSMLRNLGKVVYPEVAEKFNTTPSRVERAQRNAIEVSWELGDKDLKKYMFGNTISQNKKRPTNIMFIMTIVDYLQQQDGKDSFKANA